MELTEKRLGIEHEEGDFPEAKETVPAAESPENGTDDEKDMAKPSLFKEKWEEGEPE